MDGSSKGTNNSNYVPEFLVGRLGVCPKQKDGSHQLHWSKEPQSSDQPGSFALRPATRARATSHG